MLAYKETSTVTSDEQATYAGSDSSGVGSFGPEGERMSEQNKIKAYQAAGGQQQGYNRTPQPGSPTYTEAWALVEAARRMAEAIGSADLDDADGRRRLRDALRLNWRLWTIFQAELTVGDSNQQSPVPEEIRMNMLTLAKFVDNHTISIMSEPSVEKVATLIDINRNIASGLLESVGLMKSTGEQETADQPAKETAPDHEPEGPHEVPGMVSESFDTKV